MGPAIPPLASLPWRRPREGAAPPQVIAKFFTVLFATADVKALRFTSLGPVPRANFSVRSKH